MANGGVAAGVTAATAIAALQESSGKLSRNMIDDGYEAFADVITLCIELVRQFYDMPRRFRLLGNRGEMMYVSYSNTGLQPVAMDDGFGLNYRVPEFDLEIAAQQESPYRTMEYNQLALQLFQLGFFRPDMAGQALKCLQLMDFKNKDVLMQVIEEGQTQQKEIEKLRGQLMQVAQIVDAVKGSHLQEALAKEFEESQTAQKETSDLKQTTSHVEQVRKQTRQAVRPR